MSPRPSAWSGVPAARKTLATFTATCSAAWLLLIASAWAWGIEQETVISVYQGECAEGDFSTNLQTVRGVCDQALARGSHFVVFPECFLSGYENREAVVRGARGLDDPELVQWIDATKAHDMVILVGIVRKLPQDKVANTQLVIHRGRIVGYYDKVMLTWGDRHTLGFEAGTAVPIFNIHGVKFGINICHDTSFPHVAMMAKLQGAELLFTPHNNEISTQVVDDHRAWVRNCHVGLACQMKMVVARANIVKSGREGSVGYGDSFILSPQGNPLVEADLFKSELITATITPAMFQSPYVWSDLRETPGWLRAQLGQALTEARPAYDEEDLRFWLENMAVHHGYNREEMSEVLGLSLDEVDGLLVKHALVGKASQPRRPGDALRTLPYPGGRHPRTGFLDGAVMPQRETKVSVFTPWDDTSYVVADIPEAIFSNLGLVYLAHTHVPTLWDLQGVRLPRQEWERRDDGSLELQRRLPNGIAYGAKIRPEEGSVRMELTLTNGTEAKLTGLRVQNCVMLARAQGFEQQSNDNKRFLSPYAIAGNAEGNRWILTAWDPIQRCWGNPPCPCLHSDPQFPDCEPGQTVRVRGWLSFYEGTDLEAEIRRIEATGWRDR